MLKEKFRFLDTYVDGKKVEDKPEQDFYFLGIGIDKYENMPNLDNPCREVTEIRDLLVDKYGFAPYRTELLLDEDATRKQVLDKIYELCSAVSETDSVIIYFAGHGYLESEILNEGYWIPFDAEPRSERPPISSYISNSEVVNILAKAKPLHILLLVDSCFGGAIFQAKLRASVVPGSLAYPSRFGISSGMKETVTDQSDFFRFLKEALEKNTHEFFSGSSLFSRIGEKMHALGTRQTPIAGRLECQNPEAIGEFHFVLQDEWIKKPKGERLQIWKGLTLLHSLFLMLGITGWIGVLLLSWSADYWPRLGLATTLVYLPMGLLLIRGFGQLLIKGKGLSLKFSKKRTVVRNRVILTTMVLLQLFLVLNLGYSLFYFQTLEVKLSPDHKVDSISDLDEAIISLSIRIPGQEEPLQTISLPFNETYQTRLPQGKYVLGVELEGEGSGMIGGVVNLDGGINTYSIVL